MPIIFLTARNAIEDKLRGLTVGGDDYVTKPFSLEELVARIRVICAARGPPATTTTCSASRTSSSTKRRATPPAAACRSS